MYIIVYVKYVHLCTLMVCMYVCVTLHIVYFIYIYIYLINKI